MFTEILFEAIAEGGKALFTRFVGDDDTAEDTDEETLTIEDAVRD